MANHCDWFFEKIEQGMYDPNYKADAEYGLEKIRTRLAAHIAALPGTTNQAHRDELTEIDWAIADALALLGHRTYGTHNTEEDRYAQYVTFFVVTRMEELVVDAK